MKGLTRLYFFVIAGSFLVLAAWQKKEGDNYTVQISTATVPFVSNHLELGTHTNAKGESLDANSLYFIKNGKPWYPVMGEFHFSRFPKDQWESSILKMKAAGIDVIATYIFWIYHEEEEGTWDWSNNRNLRSFAALCKKHDMFLFARVGPWCHGEVRNGGLPDWLLKKHFKTRTSDSAYMDYVAAFFKQIDQQLSGLYFKNGGPVIGAQIENEFRFNNPRGLEHILALKKMAVAAGIDVPYYTATGWPGSDIKQTALVPVWGGYPEAPWDKRTERLPLSENYLFTTLRSDPNIGNDLLGDVKDTTNFSGYRYPYATAEMGAGIQITYHRRPIISPDDVTGLAYVKAGSGANLLGYYMFHGGSNEIGKFSTLQESKATGYPNDYPIINYDFQAPIGEWGQLRPSYRHFKTLHYFLNDFGSELVQDYAFFPDKKPTGAGDSTTLRWSVRAGKNSGFIFINNFQRQLRMPAFKDVQFSLNVDKKKQVQIPAQPIDIPANTQMIWPFQLQMGGALLHYATVQPVCILKNQDTVRYVFCAEYGVRPEYVFDTAGIKNIKFKNGTVTKKGSQFVISNIKPGMNAVINLMLANGKTVSILTVTKFEANNAWKIKKKGNDYLIFSSGEITQDGDDIYLTYSSRENTSVNFYPAVKQLLLPDGISTFMKFGPVPAGTGISFPKKNTVLTWKRSEQKPMSKSDSVKGMPVYSTTLQNIPSATYWQVQVPKDVLKGLNNAYLKIKYTGDTQAAYLDGKLIADDFNNGLPMMIGLNQFKNIGGKTITLLVTPLAPDSKIYFEDKVRNAIGSKGPAITEISIVPEYKTIMHFK